MMVCPYCGNGEHKPTDCKSWTEAAQKILEQTYHAPADEPNQHSTVPGRMTFTVLTSTKD